MRPAHGEAEAELERRAEVLEGREKAAEEDMMRRRQETEASAAGAKLAEDSAARRLEEAARVERTAAGELFEAEQQLHLAEAERRLPPGLFAITDQHTAADHRQSPRHRPRLVHR